MYLCLEVVVWFWMLGCCWFCCVCLVSVLVLFVVWLRFVLVWCLITSCCLCLWLIVERFVSFVDLYVLLDVWLPCFVVCYLDCWVLGCGDLYRLGLAVYLFRSVYVCRFWVCLIVGCLWLPIYLGLVLFVSLIDLVSDNSVDWFLFSFFVCLLTCLFVIYIVVLMVVLFGGCYFWCYDFGFRLLCWCLVCFACWVFYVLWYLL